MDLTTKIRDIPDFPKPGILFKDVTPLLADGPAFLEAVDRLAEGVAEGRPDVIVAIESRGFIFGAAVATRLGVGMVPVRKPGKLPYRTRRETYALEYGADALEMHEDAIVAGSAVAIVDDVLATGGTAAATARLVEKAGGRIVGMSFLIELGFLAGRKRLVPHPVSALLCYD
ncbi:MAG TPA: adenine phosphoribosyltransferase [Haliangiales bacterium]|nr:adenine phosphoribosyltransferase [Haliangiales bacterium]